MHLKLIYFLLFTLPLVFPQCLSYNTTGQTCSLCSAGYYQINNLTAFPNTSCQLSFGFYSSNVVITQNTSFFNNSSWSIYNDLWIAMETEDNLSKSYNTGQIYIYLTNEPHFLRNFDEYSIFFRFNPIKIFIQPLYCNETIMELCYGYKEKATILFQTEKVFFFISRNFTIFNIIFDGSNLTSNSYTSSSTYALFNLEARIDEITQNIANLSIFNCDFINFNGGILGSFININDLPSYLYMENITINNTLLNYEFFSIKNINSDSRYSFISNLSAFINNQNFSKSLIFFKNVIFYNIINNGIVINTQGLSPKIPIFLLFNVTFQNIFYLTLQNKPFVSFNGIISLGSSLVFTNITNCPLLSVTNNSFINLYNITIQNCNFSSNIAISVVSSNFNITNGIFNKISSFNSTSNKMLIFLTNSISYLNGIYFSNIQNFTIITSSNTVFNINSSYFINILLLSDLLSVSYGAFNIYNITVISANSYSNSYFPLTSIFTGNTLNFKIFNSYITTCIIGNVFNVLTGNISISETFLSNSTMNYLILSTIIEFTANNFTFLNSVSSLVYLNKFVPLSLIPFNITNSLLQNITTSGALVFRMVSTLIYLTNTQLINFSMSLSVRSLFKNDYSVYILLNCLFKNVGYIGDTSILTKNYDKSLFTLYIGVSFYLCNLTFITDGKLSLRGGFVNTYTTTANITVINSSFIVLARNPLYGYHALILYGDPSVYIENTHFEGFLCPPAPSTILHDNGAAINVVGTLVYTQVENTLIFEVFNCTFKNNHCYTGGAINCLNIDKITFRQNIFISNSALSSGGHITLLYGSSAIFQGNQYFSSSAGQNGGAIEILSVTLVSLNFENIFNSSSIFNGGLIYCSFLNILNISNSSFINGLSGSDGGGIYLFRINAVLINVNFENISSPTLGGVIFLSTSSNINITNITSLNNFAYKGGFIYAKNSEYINIKVLQVISSFSIFNGAVIYIDKSLYFIAFNIFVINCSTQSNGIIYLQEPRSQEYELQNIYCKNNFAILGSCIFAYSNLNFQINNLTVESSIGNAIYFQSLGNSYLSINTFIFLQNNKNINNSSIQLNNLIELNYIEFTMINGDIFDNLAKYYLINIIDSNGYIFNANFTDTCCFIEDISIASIISSNSILTVENCLFKKSDIYHYNGIINKAAIGYFDNSVIEFNHINAFKNEHNLDGLFTIYFSDFSLKSSNFSNNRAQLSGVISAQSSNLNIFDCNFIENQFNLLEDSLFTDVGLPNQQGANDIYISNSILDYSTILIIVNSTFEGISGVFIKINYLLSIEIENVTFLKESQSYFDIMTGIVLFEIAYLKIQRSSFHNLSGTVGAGLIFENIEIQGNILFLALNFSYCRALASSAFYLSNFESFLLNNSYFHSNQAVSSMINTTTYSITHNGIGGVSVLDCDITLWNCSVLLKNSVFLNNTASLFAPTFFSKIPVSIDSTLIFLGNTDEFNITNRVISYPIKIQGISTDNMTIVSGVGFNMKFQIVDFNEQLLKFQNDSQGQIKGNYGSEQLNFFNDITKCQNGLCNFASCQVRQFPDTHINIQIQVQINEFLFSPHAVGLTSKIDLVPVELYTYVRPCLIGEILQDDLSCFLCASGSYSLRDPMDSVKSINQKCEACFENAICLQGNIILPLSGYWRRNENSTTMVACERSNDCLGNNGIITAEEAGNLTDIQLATGICSINQYGNLCSECSTGYARLSPNALCESCENIKVQSYVIMAVMMVIIFVYIAYTVKIYKTVFLKQNFTLKVLLKILVNHMQQMAMITLLDLNWSIDIKSFFNFMQLVSFMSDDLFTTDCLFGTIGYNIYIMKVIFISITPILFSFVFLILSIALFFIYSKINKNTSKITSKLREILLFFMVCVFVFYPQIMKMCFSLINCMTIDKSINLQVLVSYPSVECWTYEHITWIASISITGILIWGIIVPLLCLLFLYRNRYAVIAILEKDSSSQLKNHNSTLFNKITSGLNTMRLKIKMKESGKVGKIEGFISNSQKGNTFPREILYMEPIPEAEKNNGELANNITLMSFLFKGYTKNYYYWEIIMFLKKMFLTFIINFTGVLNTQAKIIVITLYFVSIIMLNLKCKPYESKLLNDLDTASILNAFLTANIGIFMYSNSFEQAHVFFLILLILSNISFFLVWAYIFLDNLENEKSFLVKIKLIIMKICLFFTCFSRIFTKNYPIVPKEKILQDKIRNL